MSVSCVGAWVLYCFRLCKLPISGDTHELESSFEPALWLCECVCVVKSNLGKASAVAVILVHKTERNSIFNRNKIERIILGVTQSILAFEYVYFELEFTTKKKKIGLCHFLFNDCRSIGNKSGRSHRLNKSLSSNYDRVYVEKKYSPFLVSSSNNSLCAHEIVLVSLCALTSLKFILVQNIRGGLTMMPSLSMTDEVNR